MPILSAQIGPTTKTIFKVNDEVFRAKFPGTSYAVTSLFFCNFSQTLATLIDMYLIPAGLTAQPANLILTKLSLAPLDTFALDSEKIILGDNDSIAISSTVAEVSCVLSLVRVA